MKNEWVELISNDIHNRLEEGATTISSKHAPIILNTEGWFKINTDHEFCEDGIEELFLF